MKITVNAPAKINLFLDIIGKLDNGYHSLFMVMQTVGLCDEITVEKSEESGLSSPVPRKNCRVTKKTSHIKRLRHSARNMVLNRMLKFT